MAQDTSFIAKVRRGRVIPPIGRTFDADRWTAERAAFPAGVDDDALHAAGLWVNAALHARWQRIDTLGFSVLNPAFTYRLIAMAANKAELNINQLLRAEIANTEEDIPFSGIAARRLGPRAETAATADMWRTRAESVHSGSYPAAVK